MPKQPLFPHIPGKRQRLFPHVPKGQRVERLPQTEEKELKHFWVEENKPYGTWAVVEAFPGGTVRSPFDTKEEAIKRELEIGVAYGWALKQVPSPQEKFPKQQEVLKGLYPYDILEYHDDGDLTVQSYEPLPRPKVGFKKGYIFVVTTDGKIFKQERLPATTETLPFTIKEPVLLPAVAEGTYAWLIIDPETGEIMIKPGYATIEKARRSVRGFAITRSRYAGEHSIEVRIYDREPDIDDLASGVIFKGELRLPEGTIVEEPASRVLEQLTKDVCYDFRAIRSAVMKHAWELMEKERQPFRTAIKRAWDEVKRQCGKLGAVV